MKYVATLLWVIGAVLLVGCSSTREYSFSITVRNETPGPVTIWLTKEGPPIERDWRSPEQVAFQSPGPDERLGGTPVPPGKTASIDLIKGEFGPGSSAWLRVYDGTYPDFSDLLAVSPKSPKRVDHFLNPGMNHLVVRSRNGRIYAETESSASIATPKK